MPSAGWSLRAEQFLPWYESIAQFFSSQFYTPKATAPAEPGQLAFAELAGCLVAGDGFGGFFGGCGRLGAVAVGVAVAVRMAVGIGGRTIVSCGGGDVDRFACGGEISWGGCGDV